MKTKKIAPLDLGSFRKPIIPGNPSRSVVALWYLVNATLFQGRMLGLVPGRWKAAILRAFGARVGRGSVIKPQVSIKSPWFLDIGDHVWIGEKVWIDNHTTVRIGSNCCLSQGAYVFTGNHDWTDPAFRFTSAPVEIGAGVWITAFCRIKPGSVIPPGVVVLEG